MNMLKVSVFALLLGFSMSSLAADSIDKATGSDMNLNRNNSSRSKMQDCIGKIGDEKILCENELQYDKTKSKPNENSRLNQSRNRKLREDMKSKDLKSKDMHSNDMRSKDMESKDMKSNDMESKDMKSKDTQPNESNTINSITSSPQPNNSNSPSTSYSHSNNSSSTKTY